MDAVQTTMETRISAQEDEGQKRGSASEAVAATVRQLQERVACLEDTRRHNNIHIVVEEGAEGNDLNTSIRKYISKTLNIDVMLDFEIKHSYRVRLSRSGNRHIVVRFVKLRAREDVL